MPPIGDPAPIAGSRLPATVATDPTRLFTNVPDMEYGDWNHADSAPSSYGEWVETFDLLHHRARVGPRNQPLALHDRWLAMNSPAHPKHAKLWHSNGNASET